MNRIRPIGVAEEDQPLLLVAGPTGAGKSRAALELAREYSGAVINMDSRQIYRDFPIITAQPAAEEQRGVPHLLYGFLPCEAKMTAGVYAKLAAEAIAQCRAEGRLPILVGGTGLYIHALLTGIADIPEVPPDIFRYWQTRLRVAGAQSLYQELTRLDPDYAAKIHANDSQRITRALEKGAIEEARQALINCRDPKAPGWSGIGCAELFSFVRGEAGLEQTLDLWLRNTRAYAKRQMTWFKKDIAMRWFSPNNLDSIIGEARQFLASGR